MTVKRIIMSALVGSIAAMALAVPAQAQGRKIGACTIEGSATASVLWLGGGGTFSFGPTGLGIDCFFVTGKSAGGFEAGVAELVLGSQGSFDNILCGTGTAADDNPTVTSVTTTPDSPKSESVLLNADLGYHITFVGFQGFLTWGANATPGNPRPNTGGSSTEPVGFGVINISPWRGPGHPLGSQGGTYPGTPPFGECTNGFNVEGDVDGSISAPLTS